MKCHYRYSFRVLLAEYSYMKKIPRDFQELCATTVTRINGLPNSERKDFEKSLESLNGGLANGGLRYLSTIDHDCLQLSSFCDEKSLNKRPRMCTIADDCAQIAETGLEPPFESSHFDFPKRVANSGCDHCRKRG